MNDLKIRRLLTSIIAAADLLENGCLNDSERRSIRDIQDCNLQDADKLGVPYSVQNAALAAGTAMKRRGYSAAEADALMEKYAEKLTPEFRSEWKKYREMRILEGVV